MRKNKPEKFKVRVPHALIKTFTRVHKDRKNDYKRQAKHKNEEEN